VPGLIAPRRLPESRAFLEIVRDRPQVDSRPPILILPSAAEAATKVEDWAAARSQRLAFSGQLLNQDREQAFDLYSLL